MESQRPGSPGREPKDTDPCLGCGAIYGHHYDGCLIDVPGIDPRMWEALAFFYRQGGE